MAKPLILRRTDTEPKRSQWEKELAKREAALVKSREMVEKWRKS